MHVTFRNELKEETRINLNLSVEEATALFWSIDPKNRHMERFIPSGYRRAFTDLALEIENQIQSRLIETGNNPENYSVPKAIIPPVTEWRGR